MPREIASVADVQNQQNPATTTNDFKDRLVKLIPSEIVTAYITLHGLISDHKDNLQTFTWIVFLSLLILTPLYLFFISNVKKPGQVIFTTVAYIIWVLATGGFMIMLPSVSILNEFLGSLILIIYTLIIPFVYKG
jgi:hypothetical protein